MDEQIIGIQVVFVIALVGFGVWFSRMSFQMHSALGDIQNSDEQLDEIRESVEVVVAILNRLPELLPQFHMNTNPLQPLIEMFAQKLSGAEQLITVPVERGMDGRFSGTEEQQEETPKA
jgi:hypothetical protein